MATRADVVIIGGGVMGTAAAYQLAKDGRRVVLLERYTVGNRLGSSYGTSRVFRLIHSDLYYVRLAIAARDAWRALEAESGEQLLLPIQAIDLGPAERLAPYRDALIGAGLGFEQLDRQEIVQRFPQLVLPDETIGLYQLDYGLLAANRCVATFARLARQSGADIREGERVLAVETSGAGVVVRTENAAVEAERVIIAAGAWTGPLLESLGLWLPLVVTQELHLFYRPRDPASFQPDRFPLFRHHLGGHSGRWGVAFPMVGPEGVKTALDCTGPVVDPEDNARSVEPPRRDRMDRYFATVVPSLGRDIIAEESCRYTMTPDEDFVLDRHPTQPSIVVASPCSGHGFKFAPLIGRILADLAIGNTSAVDIGRFRVDRAALSRSLP